MQKFLLLKIYYNTAIILGQVKDLALSGSVARLHLYQSTTVIWFFVLLWLNQATILDPDLICFDIIA